MLTIFTTPKAFRGHIEVIQRNALKSWTLLHPDVEVIVFGDEEGAAEVCRELGLRHEPAVERSASSTKYVQLIFGRAQEMARHDVMVYANCDIVLTEDFLRGVARVAEMFGAQGAFEGENAEAQRKRRENKFLMVGRRWDTEITTPIDFSASDWAERTRALALQQNRQQSQDWIDYFVFPRGMYREIPALVIGRVGWDNWLVWKARSEGVAVVDASAAVVAIHQNHDYGYHPQGKQGVWEDAEAQRNYALAGGVRHIYSMDDATHRLTAKGIEANPGYRLAPARRALRRGRAAVWHALLRATRPVRHALGIKKTKPLEPQMNTDKHR
ncbi:MAG: hypothetical protein HY234_12390 [Acidobacteria bacterium]|nr:hypothetical protein [Acidobacteriota bacterium]